MDGTFLYSLTLCLIWLQSVLCGSNENTFRLIVTVIAFAFIVVKIIYFDKLSTSEGFVILGIMPFVVISYLANSSEYLVLAYLLAIGCKGIDLNRLFKSQFWFRALVVSAMVILTSLGWMPSNNLFMVRMIGVDTYRYSFGFEHPNMAQMNIGIIIILFFLWQKDRYTWKSVVVAELVGLVFGYYTDSRTGVLALTIIMILVFLNRYSGLMRLILKKLSFLQIVFPIIVLAIYYAYNDLGWMQQLNVLMQGRLWNGKYFLFLYDVKPFGQMIDAVILLYSVIIIDTYFLYILLSWGWILTVLVIYLSFRSYQKAVSSNELLIAIYLLFNLIYGVSEALFINPAYNFGFVLMGYFLYKRKSNG